MDRHNLGQMAHAIEDWYRAHARDLPWRVRPHEREAGVVADPYRVWLSEVMLQQTTGPHAAPYYHRFVERWPDVEALAAASWEEVSAAWAGLGYYSRARNLHAAAKQMRELGLPETAEGWRGLPGVGPYTAAAVAAIALGERIAPVDGNIERVLSRVFAIGSDRTEAGWRLAKREIAARAQALVAASPHHPGDLAQALMDLGATICTPMRPACPLCPLFLECVARRAGEQERYPEKPSRKDKPIRRGTAFVVQRTGDSAVWLVRRPPQGLLGGMRMPPTTDWLEDGPPEPPPSGFAWVEAGEARHVFTHFALRLDVLFAESDRPDLQGIFGAGDWVAADEAAASVPTVGRKAILLGLGGQTRHERN